LIIQEFWSESEVKNSSADFRSSAGDKTLVALETLLRSSARARRQAEFRHVFAGSWGILKQHREFFAFACPSLITGVSFGSAVISSHLLGVGGCTAFLPGNRALLQCWQLELLVLSPIGTGYHCPAEEDLFKDFEGRFFMGATRLTTCS
jgi:hypothetical protein